MIVLNENQRISWLVDGNLFQFWSIYTQYLHSLLQSHPAVIFPILIYYHFFYLVLYFLAFFLPSHLFYFLLPYFLITSLLIHPPPVVIFIVLSWHIAVWYGVVLCCAFLLIRTVHRDCSNLLASYSTPFLSSPLSSPLYPLLYSLLSFFLLQ